jgi:hypothetical protein
VFQPGSTAATLTYRPVSGGSANLTLSLPPGFLQAPVANTYYTLQPQLSFTVSAAKPSVNTATIGRDLQQNMSVSSDGSIKPQTQLTITSSDPSRLLLAPDANTPGQGSITITSTGFYAQALSDSGTVNISVSADGYQSGSGVVTLAPSAVVFGNYSNQLNLYSNSGTQHLYVSLSQLDPVSLQPQSAQAPWPGVNLAVTVTSSDPRVLSVSTPSIQFPNQPVVDIKPVAIGTAILSLGLLPGGISPASGRQMVVNIAEPTMLLPDFTIGRDLAAPVQVSLGSSTPTPTTDLGVYLQPFNVLLSNSATDPGTFGISITIPAGQRVSRPFYLQGRNSTGAATIQNGGGGYNSAQPADGTVIQTAFIFCEAARGRPSA